MNIKEFAKILGVSTATISRAFTNKGRISEKTRRMIKDKAVELGYRANIHARNLIAKKSNTIGFFYPSLGNREPDYFISEIMLGVSETAAELNRILQIHPVYESIESNKDIYADYILNGSVEGIIVVAGTPISVELVKIAKVGGVPYIVIGHMSGERGRTVTFPIEQGAKMAGRYFRDTGRSFPAYIGGFLDRHKKKGFTDGLGKIGKKIIFDCGGTTFRHGSMAFERIHKENRQVDCLLCANDVLAIGFIRAALKKSVRIPQDIAVIGCDDIRIARFYSPALTTIAFHEYEIGQKAVRQLNRLLNSDSDLTEEVVECDLILRESA